MRLGTEEIEVKIDSRLLEFLPPTDRVKRLKDDQLTLIPELCIERARIITKADKEFSAFPANLKRAYCLEKILKEMSIYILEGELIVGNQARKDRAAPVFPEFDVSWLSNELETLTTRAYDPFIIYEDEKPEWKEIINYWNGRTNVDKVRALEPEEISIAKKSGMLLGEHIISGGHGHITPNYEKLFKVGMKGYIDEIDEELINLDLTRPIDIKKFTFLKGVKIVFQASIDFANRYADLAEQEAKKQTNEKRRMELLSIAKNCRNVPKNPPQNLWEAIQCAWFILLICQIESSGHSMSFGRLDQNLIDYYIDDTNKKNMTLERAQELLGCLFIKTHSVNKVRALGHTVYSAGYPMYENLTIGGQKGPGINAENDMSFLIINAVENIRFPDPNLVARIWHGSSSKFLKKIGQSLSLGFGMPAMLSDEAIIPSLIGRGISKEDAYNYCSLGCIEVSVAGKWGYRCLGMTYINLSKMLEVALFGGIDHKNPNFQWSFKKTLAEMESFDEVIEAWRKSVKIFTRLEVINDTIADIFLAELPEPFVCGLTDDCIKRGKGILEGGAIYDMISGAQIGIANVANTLAAIKKLIFEDKVLTGAELLNIMQNNFNVPNGEFIRQKMLNHVPKYGNDNDYVDDLAVLAYGIYQDEIEQYKNSRDGQGPLICGYTSSTVTISTHVGAGKKVGATPDGRKDGENLSEGASPWSGTDVCGPTAVMKTVSKIPTMRMTGGQLLNLKFNDDILKNEDEQEKLINLIRAFFFELKGWHVQINAVSPEVLKDAQIHPEKHRGLMVRVAGYCALFTELDLDIQNEIISRTTHSFVR